MAHDNMFRGTPCYGISARVGHTSLSLSSTLPCIPIWSGSNGTPDQIKLARALTVESCLKRNSGVLTPDCEVPDPRSIRDLPRNGPPPPQPVLSGPDGKKRSLQHRPTRLCRRASRSPAPMVVHQGFWDCRFPAPHLEDLNSENLTSEVPCGLPSMPRCSTRRPRNQQALERHQRGRLPLQPLQSADL